MRFEVIITEQATFSVEVEAPDYITAKVKAVTVHANGNSTEIDATTGEVESVIAIRDVLVVDQRD
jgi:hypothetical protein